MSKFPFSKGLNAWASFLGPSGLGVARGPAGRWRIFDRGDLKFVILRLLRERPMHGYEVMRALEEEAHGCYSASAGSVYPALQWLEDEGYVRSEEGPERKVYSITDAGRAFLEKNRARVEEVFERVAEATRHFTGRGMTEVTRSFARLAQVSFERTVRRPGDAEALERLREILDRAVDEVEAAVDGESRRRETR